MKGVVRVVEAKYPKAEGYRLFGIFDQSGCHTAFADDSLNMNAKERGAQPLMYNTVFNGKVISMTKEVRKATGKRLRIPRGMIDILKQ